MRFFKQNWWNLLLSLLLAGLAVSLNYNANGYCDDIPYPLALCGFVRIGFDLFMVVQFLIGAVLDPIALFTTTFNLGDHEVGEMSRGFLFSGSSGFFIYLLVVRAFYDLISFLASRVFKKIRIKVKTVYQ